MLPLNTVLCPVDFSPATPRQVALAVKLCEAFGARLVLHHNLAGTGVGAAVGWMWAADHHAASEPEIERKMKTLLDDASRTVGAEARITRGPASQAVLTLADAIEADLVIVATHGASTADHTSVAGQVLDGSHRAVLVLHDSGTDAHSLSFTPENGRQVVLVAVDFTPESNAAVALACELARRLPVQAHLVHFLPHLAAGGERRQLAQQARERLASLVPADLALTTTVHVDEDNPRRGIVRIASELGAACIVMGEHTRAPLRRWFTHDTSHAVLHTAPCPVWYVGRT